MTTRAEEHRAGSKNANNLPQSPYDVSQVTTGLVPEELQAQACNESYGLYGLWCYNRQFFRAEAGRFGWGTDVANPGDEVCIFYGGGVPLIVRPVGQGQYEVVGNGCLHGFMPSEAMVDEIEEQEFELV